MNVMPVDQLIIEVTKICKKNGVKRLDLFWFFRHRDCHSYQRH